MKAKEMFEKLGYELKIDCDTTIEYVQNNDIRIIFYKEPCYTICKYYWSYNYDEAISCDIEVEELAAINQQVKELEWLDNNDIKDVIKEKQLKEILYGLDYIGNKIKNEDGKLELGVNNCKLLSDHITNLQEQLKREISVRDELYDNYHNKINNLQTSLDESQEIIADYKKENEYLKTQNDQKTKIGIADHKYASKKEDEIITYKLKIEKARECIKDIFKDENWYENYKYNDLEDALKNVDNILNGGDEERN